MKTLSLGARCALAVMLGGLLVAAPAFADKPNGKGKNKAQKVVPQNGHFGDSHRSAVHSYYDQRFQRGQCPPGLAKKNNGCLPPGQAKKWQLGQPLARNVTQYPLPRALVTQIGQPPAGHHYVRVGDDILLITAGQRMVIDVMQALGRT